jgi:hypothetical protein
MVVEKNMEQLVIKKKLVIKKEATKDIMTGWNKKNLPGCFKDMSKK